MISMTIIIAVLAASAAIFTVLFFLDRNKVRKSEEKSNNLALELSDLRCEMARKDAQSGDLTSRLTKEKVVEFLRNEKTYEVTDMENTPFIEFLLSGKNYLIDCSRFPQQLILDKKFVFERVNYNVDALVRAANKVTKDLIMVKIAVNDNDTIDFEIVSADHTVAALRENLDFYISILNEAVEKHVEEYGKIMEAEYPKDPQSSEEAKRRHS